MNENIKVRTVYNIKPRGDTKLVFGNPGTYVAHEFNTDSQEWEIMFEKESVRFSPKFSVRYF